MNKEDIWDIKDKQQTQIKLDILRKYLKAWGIIIGNYYPEAYFVDCFAGRGKYHLGSDKDKISGSPLIGIEVALDVKEIKQRKNRNFDLKVIAIESDNKNLGSLKKFSQEVNADGKVFVELIDSEFEKAIPTVLGKIGNKPAFFFIDPYGIKGLGRNSLDPIIGRNGPTEIFLNYMQMAIQRVTGQQKNVEHENDGIRIKAIKTVSHMDNLFGDKSWIGKGHRELLVHFVKEVLGKNYKFVMNFNVPYPDRSGTIYNLLFATNKDVAQKIMKDIFTKKMFENTLFAECPFHVEWDVK